jgi:oxalate decarboxylase/phosphoglucose isomerase-like protein (cupin superfamily)
LKSSPPSGFLLVHTVFIYSSAEVVKFVGLIAARYMATMMTRGNEMPKRLSVESCRTLDFPRIQDRRGNLTFVEGGHHIPFEIRRVYYLYDVPGGAARAGHAHKQLEQILVAMSGSFDVTVDDGHDRKRVHLCRSYYGLYIPPMIWREIDNFSSGSVCLALASAVYDEDDYYREYEAFAAAAKANRREQLDSTDEA